MFIQPFSHVQFPFIREESLFPKPLNSFSFLVWSLYQSLAKGSGQLWLIPDSEPNYSEHIAGRSLNEVKGLLAKEEEQEPGGPALPGTASPAEYRMDAV